MSVSIVLHRWTKHLVVCGIVIAAFAGLRVLADEPPGGPALPLDRGLMQRQSNFTLKDVTNGRSLMLYGFQGRKAIVLVFLANDCPVVNLYVPRLIELNREFSKKGVVILGINSNAHETEAEVAQFVKERGIDFAVLKDPGKSGRRRDAGRANRGSRCARRRRQDPLPRRDRRPALAGQEQGCTRPQLRSRCALTALISGGKIAVPATKVAGCLIDRIPPKAVDPSKIPKLARRRAGSHCPAFPAGSRASHRGRKGLLFGIGRRDLAEQVPGLPSAGPGCAVLAPYI